MKILKVDPHYVPYSWAWSCERALKSLGQDVRMFIYRDYLSKNRLHRLAQAKSRFIAGIDAWLMNKKLLAVCRNYQPDLVFVSKGELIFPDTLAAIKKLGIRTVNWISDDPFRYLADEVLPLYDLFFVYDPYFIEILGKKGAKNPLYLPLAFDEEIFKTITLTAGEKEKFGSDLCFVGTHDRQREEMLASLAGKFNLKIWGSGWKAARSESLRANAVDKFLSPVDINKVYNASKICLNIHHEQTRWGVNMRTFEATGSGCLLVTDNPRELRNMFVIGNEVAIYSDKDETNSILERYLKNGTERQRLALNGQQRSRNHHTYAHRMQNILKTVEEL
ncbi:MAG: glycosyltransferase [bacterium]|nr:glycosyltransferase [bacterium]MDD5354422.1 glycosyltransferase [bacterium]MDD5755710.1 glycosyltransferase [bacterium]